MTVAGTADDPVVVTSVRDDSIVGDTGGDGPSDPQQAQGFWNDGLARAEGGAIRIDHGDFRWLHAPLTAYSQQLGVFGRRDHRPRLGVHRPRTHGPRLQHHRRGLHQLQHLRRRRDLGETGSMG